MHTKLAYGLAVASALGLSEVYSAELQKRDGSHGHGGHSHEPAPSSGYDTPSAGYSAPDTGYAAPSYAAPSYDAPSYGAPDTGYGAPDTGYGAPATGYGAPSYGGGNNLNLNLDFLTWIPAIAMLFVGLSLLFPNMRSVSARKKRSLANGKRDVLTNSPLHKTP